MNQHGNTLPFINISSPFGRPLRFLIDTGASVSFINPEFIEKHHQIGCQPITITTILDKYKIDKKVILPVFTEFKEPGHLTFLVFKFHNYFDGLIGIDALTQIKAKIDLSTQLLRTPNASIPLRLKPNITSGKHIIPNHSKIIIELPVDVQNGDILMRRTMLSPYLHISEGLYKAENWFSQVEVQNTSNEDQILYLEQPLKVESYSDEEYLEVNNWNLENPSPSSFKEIKELIRTDHLNSEEKKELISLCRFYDDIFFKEGDTLTFTNNIKHCIATTDDIPIHTKSYRYPYIHKEEVASQISSMLNQGIIRQSYSPWSSPVWIVPKKRDASGKQKWRLVIDYRKLNEKTISDRYPIPNITEILDKLGRSMYFSTLDLASGFHQIEMDPKDVQKTAFTVEGGHYEYIRMPFGLKNAPSTFQRVMDNVLGDLVGKTCLVYLDDIIIFSTSLQQHMARLKEIFERLKKANLKVQLDKSEFLRKEIAFLGHVVTTEGIKPNPDKIHAIKNFPIPKTQKDIRTFLGLLGYYRKFIKDFARLVKPMTVCLKKGRSVELTENYIKTFQTCKHILTNDPILQYPDFTKPFILTTDASNVALGAILSQGNIGSDRPICFASRTLSDSETNYSTIEKELLAIVWATKYFRPYLFGRKFQIVTDHRPLTWLMSLKEPNSKLIRWRLKLEEYDYTIIYKKGKRNTNADALSRIRITNPESKSKCDVNTNEIASNQGTKGTTVHSANENLDDGIYISEKPLNEFNLQIILEQSSTGSPMTLETVFKNKQRRIIRRPIFNVDVITEIFKKFLAPNKLNAIFTDDETFRIVQTTYSKYFAHNKLFKIIRCMEILTDVRLCDEQEKIIREYHENNNHRGINETFLHIKRQYYFPFLKNKITQTINNCEKCQTLKYDRNPPKLKYQKPETSSKPLEILHIDLYSINNNQMLTILDKFSKFATAYTLMNRASVTVLKSLKTYISQYGIPEKLICDQGSEFTSNIFKDFCRQYNITLHMTSFQQTSSNAPVERFHSTLTEIYRLITAKRKEMKLEIDHDEILSESLITYNNAIHSATKLTPFELFHGRTYKFDRDATFENEHDYLKKLNEFQEILYPSIKEKLETEVNNRIDRLNQNRQEPTNFEENETVFRKECRRNKLTPRFTKHKIKKDKKITLITSKNQKVHKARIKNRKKI